MAVLCSHLQQCIVFNVSISFLECAQCSAGITLSGPPGVQEEQHITQGPGPPAIPVTDTGRCHCCQDQEDQGAMRKMYVNHNTHRTL